MGRPEWFVVVCCAAFLLYCGVVIGDTLLDTWGTWRVVQTGP